MSEKPFAPKPDKPQAEPPPAGKEAKAVTDLRRFREYMTAGFAGLIIVGVVAMMVIALLSVQLSNDQFSRIKDLLLLINPILGVVIGYYFNKTSTEARAESAEQAAQTASVSAQQAVEARNLAEVETQKTKDVLREVSQAAEKVLAEPEAATKGFRGVEEGARGGDAYGELRSALARAKRLVG